MIRIRKCCKGAEACGFERYAPLTRDFVEMAQAEGFATELERMSFKAPPPTLPVATHEMAHAGSALSIGVPVRAIECFYVDIDFDRVSATDKAFVLLAGPAGEDYADRLIRRRVDYVWLEAIDFVRRGVGGNCDACRSVRGFLAEEPNADDENLIARLRAAEARAIAFITEDLDRWLNIRTAAHALLKHGSMSGEEITEVLNGDAK